MKSEQVITNKERLRNLEGWVKSMESENHNDHGRIFDKLEDINKAIVEIDTTLKIQEKSEERVLTIRIWIIATAMSAVSFLANFFWK